ncbi:MAG: hypothetical protein AMXMBFR58_24950 [Phycisphaerae bacterium]
MKATHSWHRTPTGAAILWLGSIKVAIPLLAAVTVAMVWGTYLESTQSAKVAKAVVYGSSWFMALMVMICASLILAVVTRFPWKKKHLGFITVHASLVTLIVAGFWSLYGRIEGRISLDAGMEADHIETDEEILELVEHTGGVFTVLGAATAPHSSATVRLGDLSVKVTERWSNTREVVEVVDGGPQPFRAIELSLDPSMPRTFWIGEEGQGGAADLAGLRVRLLGPDATWDPPATASAPSETPGGYVFVVDGKRIPLADQGQEAFPGWTITSIKKFQYAMVSGSGLEETTPTPGAEPNPAIDVVITDGKGTSERHTAFTKFADMVLVKTIEGTAKSGAHLTPAAGSQPKGGETVVVYGKPGALKVGYVSPDGTVHTAEQTGPLPWSFTVGTRNLSIRQDIARAREVSHFTEAPPADEYRPAMVVDLGDGSGPQPVAWKAMVPVPAKGPGVMIRYGPRTHPLPFSITLKEFRKIDYPGTEMAMAYESDVSVKSPQGNLDKVRIHMNSPLEHSGWKVYQSGFVGNSTSIFSVMRDPGLLLTYIASIFLCLGIAITFYSRGWSWGHPGIPTPISTKEQNSVTSIPS